MSRKKSEPKYMPGQRRPQLSVEHKKRLSDARKQRIEFLKEHPSGFFYDKKEAEEKE